jgi:hypothetical protein
VLAYEYIIKKRFIYKPAVRIGGTFDATNYLNTLFFDDTVEHFFILALDKENWCIGPKILAIGARNCVHITAQEVIYAAGRFNAAGLVMAHNHPNGSLTPSEADQKLERDVRAAAERITLKIHEHIILTPEEPVPPTAAPWTEEETERLRDLLGLQTDPRTITDQLQRTNAEIKARAGELCWLLPGQKVYV